MDSVLWKTTPSQSIKVLNETNSLLVKVLDEANSLLCILSHGLEKPVCIHIKQQQIEAMRCAYNRKDASFWLQTGFGKSLCYEAWPYVMGHKLGTDCSMILIILPLVSQMIDQVNNSLQ